REAWGPGCLYLIKPFEPHVIRSQPGGAHSHLAVHFDLAPDVPTAARSVADRRPYEVVLPEGATLPVRVRLAPGSDLERRLQRVVDAVQEGGPLAMARASAELALVLL